MRPPALLPACPRCDGPRLLDHPSTPIFWHASSCPYRDAEDARQAADAELRGSGVVRRPATATEVALLHEAGVDLPADDEDGHTAVITNVAWSSPGVRRRWWVDVRGEVVVWDPPEPSDTSTTA